MLVNIFIKNPHLRQCIRSLCFAIKIFCYNELSSEFSFQCLYKDCVNYNASNVKCQKRTNLSLYRLQKIERENSFIISL